MVRNSIAGAVKIGLSDQAVREISNLTHLIHFRSLHAIDWKY